MRVVILIRSLDYGGAERQAVILAQGLHSRGHAVAVAVFYAGGPLTSALESSGVEIIALDKKGRWEILSFIRRLITQLKTFQPDLIQSYLTLPNILIALLKPLFPNTKMVWGIRASQADLADYNWLYAVSWSIERRLARYADRIIANSKAGRAFVLEQGFPATTTTVIPTGIDTDRFQPDHATGLRLRQQWGIPADAFVIGLVARLDPMKGHKSFIQAAARIVQDHPHIHFVCVGDGSEAYRAELQQLADSQTLNKRLHWLGGCADMPAVYNALDCLTSSSHYGEGFSNAIGEAMACAVPCVATDVGDSAWLVGDCGVVVPAADPAALSAAWRTLLAESDSFHRRALLAHQVTLRSSQERKVRF